MELFANPYDTSKKGFYFGDLDEYEKGEKRSGAEEFEIEFIDGTDEELSLFNAMGVNQANLEDFFEVVLDFDDEDATKISILMGDMGFDFDNSMDRKDDLIVYGEFKNDEEFAMEYVDGIGSLEDAVGDNIQNYFDYESFGRDLRISGDLDDPDADEDEEQWWENMTDQEIGEQTADDLGWEGVGKNNLEMYFDWGRFARDLMFDMSKYKGVYYDPNSI